MKKIINHLIITCLVLLLACKKEDPTAPSVNGGGTKVEVKIPKLNEVIPATAEPGTVLTIKGENLSEVQNVVFGGIVKVIPEAKTNTELKVKVPVLSDGSYSLGAEMVNGKSNNLNITVAVPKPPVVNDIHIKTINENEVSFSGTNLESVTGLNIEGSVIVPKAVSATKITFQLPKLALSDRKTIQVHLVSSSGNSNLFNLEIIPRPKITKRVPQEPYAGMQFIMRGESLSWIQQITLAGGAPISHSKFIKRSEQELVIDIPKDAGTGKRTLTIHTEAGDILEEITLGNLASNTGVNPGNIAVNPGSIGNIGNIYSGCVSDNQILYFQGECHLLYGGQRKLNEFVTTPCTPYFKREINSKHFKVFRVRDGDVEVGYELVDEKPTGNLYFGKIGVNEELEISHYGRILDESSFDKNKFSLVAIMLSVQDGQISKLCNPKMSNFKDDNGYSLGTTGSNTYQFGPVNCNLISSQCPTCKECQ